MNERQAMEQYKMFVSPICDKGLISKIYRNSYNPTAENQIPTLKIGKGLIRLSPKKIRRWQQVYEKLLNIISYLRNANQNHNEISSNTSLKL